MMKFWILFALAAVAAGGTKEQADDYDLWQNDNDYNSWPNDYEWYSDEAEKLGIISSEKNEPEKENDQELNEKAANNSKSREIPVEEPKQKDYDETETDLNVEDKRILQAIDALEKHVKSKEDKAPFDLFDDYQFEDNRSDPKEQPDVTDDAVELPNAAETMRGESEDISDQSNSEDSVVINQSNEQIFNEIPNILNSDKGENLKSIEDNGNNGIFDDIINKDINEKSVEEPTLDDTANQDIFDEIRNILAGDDETEILASADDTENQQIFDETRDILAEDDETDMLALAEDTDNQQIFDETRDILAEDDETEMLAPAEDTDNQQIFDETRAILDEDDSDKSEKRNDSDAEDNENISHILSISKESEDSDETKEDETPTNNEESKPSDDDSVAKEEEQKVHYEFNGEGNDDVDQNNILEGQADEGNTKKSDVVENDTKNEKQDDEEDTVDKVIEDLNDDLKQLFETWDKLTSGDIEDDDDGTNEDDVLEYEQKYGKPFREDLVLSQRDDYDNIDNDNVDQFFAKMFDDNDDRIQDKDDDVPYKVNEPDADNASKENNPLSYNNDALDANGGSKESNDDSESESDTQELKDEENPEAADTEKEPIKTIPVEDLTPSQYEDLMKQFVMVHNAELDTNSDGFGRNVAPIHMRLSVDKPEIVESPNFPNLYVTNNIVDWILDGDGVGIELNITEFLVNGAIGDYLLIKPGGLDDTRTDGIIFSYMLNEQRNYRFMDVDRMFVRFVSRPAFVGMRGFQLFVKMVAPLPEEPEPVPAPEPLLPVPEETLTLNLGGLTLEEFVKIKEEFRQLIADMATVYINNNSIDMGLNTTEEITQITSAELCNVDWPNATYCVEITIGVPLVYEEEVDPPRLSENDLRAMWYYYIYQDPFAVRLGRLGITEFSVPDDQTVLMVWLVIAVGVLVSMGLLAFALWRFSCFEDYTRMAAYSDTDSINEKRNLDLYPTPHQTLPPLYADSDYKWDDEVKYDDSTRVDMGGFANRSYVRDELFEIDSDEDIVATPRDRYTTDV